MAAKALKDKEERMKRPKSSVMASNKLAGVKGTFFNQFYIQNPDRHPMKPWAANLDAQIRELEKKRQERLKAEAKIIQDGNRMVGIE